MLELLVVLTVSGAQPILLSIIKAAVGVGFIQIVLINESIPHEFVPDFNFIV